jgi:putative transposase
VLNRGNGRRRIFRKPGDYQAFLIVLAEALRRYRVDLLCWCLMGNHWHLVLRPRGENQLSRFMQWLTITHVRRHHGQHGQSSGHVYQGRFKSFPVEDDSHFLTLCRYVEANALRANLVERAQDWPWSSLHQRLYRTCEVPLVDWPVDRPDHWTTLVNTAMAEPELNQVRQSVQRERPLGRLAWVKKMARRLGLEQTLRDRGRPPKPLDQLSPRQRRRRKKAEVGQNGR